MLKVLVVDDESVVRRGIVLGVDWASMGCVVVGEATNGEEGIAAVERYNPNLIITDIRMPHMDGIEMMTELRRRGCRAHVILLTCLLYTSFPECRPDTESLLLPGCRDRSRIPRPMPPERLQIRTTLRMP